MQHKPQKLMEFRSERAEFAEMRNCSVEIRNMQIESYRLRFSLIAVDN